MRLDRWAAGLAPLGLLAALLAIIVRTDPTATLQGDVPPLEVLTFQRVELAPDGIHATLLNDGPDPVTIAQVQVDEAYWSFTQEPPGALGHLARARLTIPYPWVHAETHALRVVTSTGLTFDREIAVAVETPRPGWRFLWLFALIGLYVGVIPVVLGLLWYPFMGRLGPAAMDFLLALTLGLLAFLLVDTAHEGWELAGEVPGSYQGMAVLTFAAGGAFLLIELLGEWLTRRRAGAQLPWVRAVLVATGIGLHNFGEGLAISGALALGEVALGTLLILGFTLHNTTEGLAIVAPLARTPTPAGHLLLLGLIGGVPTIAGSWLGGLGTVAVWSVLSLGLGAGAIAQVMVQIARSVAGERGVGAYLRTSPVLAGLMAGFVLMYATGMMVQ